MISEHVPEKSSYGLCPIDSRCQPATDGMATVTGALSFTSTPEMERHDGHRRPDATQPSSAPSASDVSGTGPQRIEALETAIRNYLHLDDPYAVRVLLGAVAAHRLDGDLAWLLMVGPPSAAKTELLGFLLNVPGVVFLSELTARTFASGLTGPNDPSLLARLKSEILVFKDFTSVLELHRDERKAVLAQFREIYDGRYDKTWGTGKELHWTGRIGLLAGVTPVIDRHHGVMALLGQRFVLLRLRQADRRAIARRAIANSLGGGHTLSSIRAQVATFIRGLPSMAPVVTTETQERLVTIADLVTRLRSGVERSPYTREIEALPEPEMPARFARQMTALARGIAHVGGHGVVDDNDMRCVERVAIDSVPPLRRRILNVLNDGRPRETKAVAQAVRLPAVTVRRALQDLELLSFVKRTTEQRKRASIELWTIEGQWVPLLQGIPEMSEEWV